MSQTALAKQPKRVKPVILTCPDCNSKIQVKPSLTLLQDKAVTALASGNYGTQWEAAQAAGMTKQHLSVLLSDLDFTLAVEQRKQQQADKTQSSLDKLVKLKGKALDKLADVELDTAGAAAVLKIATDAHRQELHILELIGDTGDSDKQRQQARTSWLAAIEYSSHLTVRAYRRFGDAVLPGIAERVERHMLKRKT